MTRYSLNWPNIISGGFFLGLALLGLWLNDANEIGMARRMGPGYLPMLTFLAMAGVGVVMLVVGWLRQPAVLEPIHWRSLTAVAGATVLFGSLIEHLGLAAAIAATTPFASIAAGEVRPMRIVGLAAFLTALCWMVFVNLLGIGIALFPTAG